MLLNSYSYEILYEQFHWICLQGDIKLLLVTVHNRLKFEIEIIHDLSCHPIVWYTVCMLLTLRTLTRNIQKTEDVEEQPTHELWSLVAVCGSVYKSNEAEYHKYQMTATVNYTARYGRRKPPVYSPLFTDRYHLSGRLIDSDDLSRQLTAYDNLSGHIIHVDNQINSINLFSQLCNNIKMSTNKTM